MSLYRIVLAGRSFVTLHRLFDDSQIEPSCLAAKHFPLPPRPIREWLADRRREGHFAHACATMTITNANLFSNVPLSPALPYVENGSITYLFADCTVAILFKLTFG